MHGGFEGGECTYGGRSKHRSIGELLVPTCNIQSKTCPVGSRQLNAVQTPNGVGQQQPCKNSKTRHKMEYLMTLNTLPSLAVWD
eukprot:4811691-Amphidinium_carterae.1